MCETCETYIEPSPQYRSVEEFEEALGLLLSRGLYVWKDGSVAIGKLLVHRKHYILDPDFGHLPITAGLQKSMKELPFQAILCAKAEFWPSELRFRRR